MVFDGESKWNVILQSIYDMQHQNILWMVFKYQGRFI